MQAIYKLKLPGRPVKTLKGYDFKKQYPWLYKASRHVKPGMKRRVTVRLTRGRRLTFAVHQLSAQELSPAAREKVAGPGLRGESRRRFIEEGLTLPEQIAEGRLQAELEMAETIREWQELHPEDYKMRERRRAARKEARYERQGLPPPVDITGMVTPKDLAERADLTPMEIRKFLRLKHIGKRGGRYAFKEKEAERIVRAAVKHYS